MLVIQQCLGGGGRNGLDQAGDAAAGALAQRDLGEDLDGGLFGGRPVRPRRPGARWGRGSGRALPRACSRPCGAPDIGIVRAAEAHEDGAIPPVGFRAAAHTSMSSVTRGLPGSFSMAAARPWQAKREDPAGGDASAQQCLAVDAGLDGRPRAQQEEGALRMGTPWPSAKRPTPAR